MPWRKMLAQYGVGRAVIGVILSLAAGAITAYIAVSVALGTTASQLELHHDQLGELRKVDAHHEQRLDALGDLIAQQAAADLLSVKDRERIERESIELMKISGEMRRELARLSGAVETLTGLLQAKERER